MEKKYSLGLYEKSMPSELPWEEKLSVAKAFGYVRTGEAEPYLDNARSGNANTDHVFERPSEIPVGKQRPCHLRKGYGDYG